MTIETKELNISEKLKRRIEMICRFAYVEYTLTNGNIKSLYSWSNNINDYQKYNNINHPITDMAEITIKERDEENIEIHNFRRKSC